MDVKPMWPAFDPRTERDVAEILRTGRVNYHGGTWGRRFEAEFAAWLGVPHAFAVTSGTAALQLALAALGVGPGDEVIVTPYSFIASASCAALVGATPVFVDVDKDHLMDPKRVAAAITPRTKAIVAVHLYGAVADLGALARLAKKHGLALVEDCAQALGGEWRGRKVGSVGTVGCFSFCQTKHITAGGEGGMVCCRDAKIARRIEALREHGRDFAAERMRSADAAPRGASYPLLGWNFRMTEIQSCIALNELRRFDRWNLPRRRKIAAVLIEGLKGHPIVARIPLDTPTRRNAFWLLPFVLKTDRMTCSAAQFAAALQAEGVGAYAILWPVAYREKCLARFAPKAGSCPNAERLPAATIGFWAHPTYTVAQAKAAVRAFRRLAARFAVK